MIASGNRDRYNRYKDIIGRGGASEAELRSEIHSTSRMSEICSASEIRLKASEMIAQGNRDRYNRYKDIIGRGGVSPPAFRNEMSFGLEMTFGLEMKRKRFVK